MNQADFEKAQEAIYARMDRHRPSTKPPISMAAFDKLQKTAWFSAMKTGVSAGVGLVMVMPHPADATGLLMFFGGAIGFCAAGLGLHPQIKPKDKAGPLAAYTQAIMRLWGGSAPLDKEQAKRIAKLAEEYPRLRDTAIQWAASNAKQTLGLREGMVLIRAGQQLRRAQFEWKKAEKEQHKAQEISDELNAYGLLDQAACLATANTLQAHSPQPSARRAPARM